jgi:pilus assembly protein CpaB
VTRRRRALLLLGLALALGGLAATDVSRRQRALEAQLGPLTEVVVARHALQAGDAIALEDLGLRRLPARYAPPGAATFAGELAGRRLAVPVPAGGAVTPDLLAQVPSTPAQTIANGQRALELLATGSAPAGSRVDVVVTSDRRAGTAGTARLALENVEVLATHAAQAQDGRPRVAATLRVTPAQAVYLTAAQSFASDIRLLVRAPGDRRKVGALAVDDGL